MYELIRSKSFDEPKFMVKWIIIIDGTQLFSEGRKINDKSLEHHHNKGNNQETVNHHVDVLEVNKKYPLFKWVVAFCKRLNVFKYVKGDFMRKSKSMLALYIVTILLAVSITPQKVKATDSDFEITKGILLSYNGNSAEVTIPDSVKSIEALVFADHTEITKVTIPSSVVSIGKVAFSGCTNLTDISIPNTVVSIGNQAFGDTAWIENKRSKDPFVVVNGILIEGLTTTGEITIPDTVTIIGEYAFSGNTDITKVIISDSVTTIDAEAFSMCYNLKKVIMMDSVKSIGCDAFMRCEVLSSITLSKSITSIGSSVFEGCKSLQSITIPEAVKEIGLGTFKNCKELYYVSVPDTLKEIGEQTFKSCSKKLTFYGNKNSYVSLYAADNNFSYKTLAIEKSKTTVSVGDTLQLKMNSLANCVWKSRNKKIATVSSTGKVTAKNKGSVTIIASLYGKEYKCVVTVK